MAHHLQDNVERFVLPMIDELAAVLPESDPLRERVARADSEAMAREFTAGLTGETAELWRALCAEEHQVIGDWYGPNEDVPRANPTHYPTGALLPRRGKKLADGAQVVALVPVNYVWLPLSTGGVRTYAFTLGMSRGETWRFVERSKPREVTSGGRRYRAAGAPEERTIWNAELGGELEVSRLGADFGDRVAQRARQDRPAQLLRLSRA